MDFFYSSLFTRDYISASYYYNQLPLNDRISIFLYVMSRNDEAAVNALIPLTPNSASIVQTAIYYSNNDVLSTFYNDEYRNDKHLLVIAASKDNVDAMKFLHERGCVWSEDVILEAVLSNSLKCLKYAVEVAKIKPDYYIFSIATKRPTCRYYGIPPRINVVDYTDRELEILQYLHDIDCPGDWCHWYKDRDCKFCLNRLDVQLVELWYMEERNYTHSIQWLPKEMLEDIIGLL